MKNIFSEYFNISKTLKPTNPKTGLRPTKRKDLAIPLGRPNPQNCDSGEGATPPPCPRQILGFGLDRCSSRPKNKNLKKIKIFKCYLLNF